MHSGYQKCVKHIITYSLLVCGLLLGHVCFAELADPLAAAVKPEVQATFGAGSTVAYCIYLTEIIVGSAMYVKGKNPLTLLGVPIVVLFSHTMFRYIGG